MRAGQAPTWVPKVVAAALVVVIAVVLLLVYHSFRGSFTPGISVTVETDRAGLMLERGSMVKAHGVQVGTVASVAHTPSGAVIELSLDPDDAERIPAGVGADIRATTVFGAKYVTLTDPPVPGPTGLSDGAVLLASSVTVETNTVFESLSGVLKAVDPAKLNSTLGAVSSALRGRGDALGAAIDDADVILSQIEPRLDVIDRDLAAAESSADIYTGATDDLVDSLDDVAVTGGTIVDRADDLDRVLLATSGMSDAGLRVVGPHTGEIVEILDLLRPTASLLDEYSPVLPCFFQGADRARRLAEPASGGNGATMMLNSTFLLGVDPYEYPRNLPVVEATGGPRCGLLPIVAPEQTPAPYLVARTGANPFERGNTSPVFVPDSLFELLSGAPS
ncbi:phospholipid/cholesterol/gamma-HCH transport system substrate-binding protein [Rhodococcus sp. SMB37]|uniref:MCE family protein n=1 Tax=Rhodococcus sp. SMB37 TaxID=2512213 RepID=UPI00104B4077|nr:MCE family protein [Rhodococcus sp. SMB37]TCN43871.1 phospholipid/cholesterol/gamma-HCH transport system substrate-binding protein [Rhodococcus sp. SMB37]